MADRSLLAFSYCFPPMTLAEAPLAAKRFSNLPGWMVDVIAAEPRPGTGFDADLGTYAERGVRSVSRVRLPEIVPVDRLRLLSRIPDPLRYLSSRAVSAALRLGIDRYDCMVSWSNWCSSHLAALRVKRRRPSLPWVAHFSDPWVDNPYVSAKSLERAINARLERAVIEGADRVTFTTPETIDLVMAKYPPSWRTKAVAIPHGYEPALYSGERPQASNGRCLVIRYLGNFYGARTPAPLYRALAAALEQRPALAREIVIEIVGQAQNDPRLDPAFQALPPGLVTFRSPVGYRESLRLMETADVLLIVDAPAVQSVFLPSKLVDYIGAARPIVALTPPGASARLARELGCPVADPTNTAGAAAALLAGIDLAKRGWSGREDVRVNYSAARSGAQFAAALADPCAGRAS